MFGAEVVGVELFGVLVVGLGAGVGVGAGRRRSWRCAIGRCTNLAGRTVAGGGVVQLGGVPTWPARGQLG